MRKNVGFFLLIFLIKCYQSFASGSVLAQGEWLKMGIVNTGIYKLDYNFFKSNGVNPDNLDPSTIQIYGNGGAMLPQSNKAFRVDDLQENAIQTIGMEDGKFNAGDFVLFYAQGTTEWKRDTLRKTFFHVKNLYSDTAYYFLTHSKTKGKRVTENILPLENGNTQDFFDEHLVWEEDKNNLIKSGREWFGDNFDVANTFSYNFDFSGYIPGTEVKMRAQTAMIYGLNSGQSGSVTFNFALQGTDIKKMVFQSAAKCQYCHTGRSQIFYSEFTPSWQSTVGLLSVAVSADRSADPVSKVYTGFLNFDFKKKLEIKNGQVAFRSFSNSKINYSVAGAKEGSLVWEVTTSTSPVVVAKQTLSFTTGNNYQEAEYVAFTPNEVNLSPSVSWKISNQDLHSLPNVSLLIVVHPSLAEAANKLADLRRKQGISVAVATTSQIYNEFSSGAQDVTAIRDFARRLYLNAGLKNLLLFGAGSYDYKYRTIGNTNLVPCYQSRESFHTVNSYCSEDYYGFFDENEGDWAESNDGNHSMDIGVGRIPAVNLEEALSVVDKLEAYGKSISFGKWRNRIAFLADNGSNGGEGNIFLSDSERLINSVAATNRSVNFAKIYLDAYPYSSTPKGVEAPGANEALRNTINQGVFIVNYIGHGGTEGLAQENLVTKPLIEGWENMQTLPFWVTATCDFSTYDDPAKKAGGVLILTSKKGGAIGIISATRPVYQFTNFLLNQAFYNNVYKRNANGTMPDLGEVIKNTKNESVSSIFNRSYVLLGDPSMTLNYPKYTANVVKINGLGSDTLKALSEVTLEGEVREGDEIKKDFSGTAIIDIFDKEDSIRTLGQQYSIPTVVTSRNNTFFTGKVSVKNGEFKASFLVPKDINYRIGKGRISLYAFNPATNEDAAGYNDNVFVGGSNPNAREDNLPPDINLYLNDTTFKNGSMTGEEPYLLAFLKDSSGINIARSAIGHEISAVVDEDRANPVILNEYYETDLNTYKSGRIYYKMKALSNGEHTLSLKAWDTHNNSSDVKISFIVSSGPNIALQELLNYPNPAAGQTTFKFVHNKAGEDLEVNIEIFDQSGKSVHKINERLLNSANTAEFVWDFSTRDNIGPGMYVYKCDIHSLTDKSKTQSIKKLVIIR